MAYDFTHDWFGMHAQRWSSVLAPCAGKTHLMVLELGCYEGRATTWLLDNVVTHPTSTVVAVDTFAGGSDLRGAGIDFTEVERRFRANIEPHRLRVTVLKGQTQEVCRQLDSGSFDLVYVDANHEAPDVLADCVQAYRLLKTGGLCICDDYEWPGAPGNGPKEGIDAFLAAYGRKVAVTHKGYQLDWTKS